MWNLSKTYLPLLATASLLTLAACNTIDEEYTPQDKAAVLNINIYAPTTLDTRADDDLKVTATPAENALHNVRVWAYETGTGDEATPVGYAELNNIQDVNAARQTVQMLLPNRLVNADLTITAKLDFYVMANTAGLTSLTQPAEMVKRGILKNTVFGHVDNNDDFGLINPVREVGNGATDGLPMSQIATNQSIVLQNPNNNLLYRNEFDVELTRSISKIQFYFTKPNGMEGVEITSIEINGSSFPATQYIFPVEKTSGFGDVTVANLPKNSENTVVRETTNLIYMNNTTTPITIKELTEEQTPDNFMWAEGETAQQYVDKITKNSNPQQNVTMCCTTYLRETDGQTAKDANSHTIMGTIHFKIDGVDHTTTFALKNETDFVRNHQWFIYGYFTGGGLFVQPALLPWTDGGTLNYTHNTSANLTCLGFYGMGGWNNKYKIYDMRGSITNYNSTDFWQHAAVAVSDGTYTQNDYMYYRSPLWKLTITCEEATTLSPNNDLFWFQVCDAEGNVTGNSETIEIANGANDEVVFFRVVPKDAIGTGQIQFAGLTLVKHSSDTFSERIPITSGTYPGNGSNDELWIYYVNNNIYDSEDTNIIRWQ